MAGTIHLNGVGKAHLDSLIAAGKVSDGPWNAPTGGDANQYLAVDSSVPANDEAHYKYPFSNGGTVNKKALASIESYATQNNQPEIASAAHDALAKINAKSDMSEGEPDTSGTLKNVEVFKVGTWSGSKKVAVTSAMLDEIVQNFATINQVPGYGVPFKLGHLTLPGSPAYGWMSDLTRVGDTLVADFSDMDPAIVDAVRAKRYNSVSVELYPTVSFGGKTFKNVLGGVAALGAEWPAVKGLKPLSASQFAGAEERLELKEEEEMNFTQEQHEAILAAAVTKAAADAKAEMADELKAANDKATKADEDRVVAETALKTFRDDADKAKINEVITAAEKAGVIVPANKDKIAKLAASVLKVTDANERAEQIATFGDIVSGLKAKVTFGEKTLSKSDADVSDAKASDEIAAKAKALLSADTTGKLDFEGAVAKVLASNPELKTAYAAQ
jgi:hypothetical protein